MRLRTGPSCLAMAGMGAQQADWNWPLVDHLLASVFDPFLPLGGETLLMPNAGNALQRVEHISAMIISDSGDCCGTVGVGELLIA